MGWSERGEGRESNGSGMGWVKMGDEAVKEVGDIGKGEGNRHEYNLDWGWGDWAGQGRLGELGRFVRGGEDGGSGGVKKDTRASERRLPKLVAKLANLVLDHVHESG